MNVSSHSITERGNSNMKFYQKKGVLGLDTARDVMIFLLTLAVVAIAVFLALVSLQNSNLFTANSVSANNTNLIINNITTATTMFFANIPTVFSILGAVVIILAVSLILVAVGRFGSSASGGSL